MNKNNNVYQAGDLTLDMSLGQVSCSSGKSLRLSPVNMRVLETLVSRPQAVVSRAELFEQVWKNQVVSDDALTRCISDIRAQLGKTFGEAGYIETLPKRGYRWTFTGGDEPPEDAPQQQFIPAGDPMVEVASRVKAVSRWRRWVVLATVYALSMVLLASALVWVTGYLARPTTIRIAVFPTEGLDPLSAPLANQIHSSLSAALMSMSRLEVLANSAVDSMPQNPFPYFFYEFDARWVVESQLSRHGSGYRVTISVVDARTAVVVFMKTRELSALAERDIGGLDPGTIADIHSFLTTSPGL